MMALWASAAPTLLYPVYITQWKLTTFETTIVFATYPAAMIVALLFLGNLADVTSSRASMLIGLGLLAAGTTALLVSGNLTLLIAGRALMGLGVGTSLGPGTVLAGRRSDGEDAHGGAIVTASTALGLVIALIVGGAAVQAWSSPLRSVYAVLLAAILATAVLVALAPDARASERSRWRFQPLTIPRPRAVFAAGALAMSAAYSLGAVYLGVGAQFARVAVGSGSALITSLVLAVSAVAIGVTAIAAGGVRPLHALWLGAGALICGQTLMVASGETHQIWLLLIASAVGGIGYGLLFSAGISLVIRMAPAHHRAAATSTGYLIAYLVQAIVALSVGALSTSSSLMAGLVVGSAAVALIASIAILLLARTHTTRAGHSGGVEHQAPPEEIDSEEAAEAGAATSAGTPSTSPGAQHSRTTHR
jgi:MFS family permease